MNGLYHVDQKGSSDKGTKGILERENERRTGGRERKEEPRRVRGGRKGKMDGGPFVD